VKEAYVREKSVAVGQLEGRGESVSSSMTDDLQSEETTNLLLTARRDDDCFAPVNNLPRDVFKHVENLGEGIFGEVSVLCIIFQLAHLSDQTGMPRPHLLPAPMLFRCPYCRAISAKASQACACDYPRQRVPYLSASAVRFLH